MSNNNNNNKTGLVIGMFILGIVIGVVATVLVMTMLNRKNDTLPETEPATVEETAAETAEETKGSTPEDPIPTEETDIVVLRVDDGEVMMKEINIYLYQLRDFYTAQYGEMPWNTEMEDGRKLHEYAKEELFKGLVRTEILNSKAEEYGVALSEEELQQCADEAKAYIEGLGPAISQDFSLTEEGARIMNEKQALSTKVYNAVLDELAMTAEDTSETGLAQAFEELYGTWREEYTVTTDPIWNNIVVGSVG